MAELTTQERLQPSLLDRLTDQARFRERVDLVLLEEVLARVGISRREFRTLMETREFAFVDERSEGGRWLETYESASGSWRLRQLLEQRFRPRRDAHEVKVGELVEVVRRQLLPNTSESQRDRVISSRQLKQSVVRDLEWLLNTGNLATVIPLEAYPQVRGSVVNYGIPDLAGTTASSADVEELAEAIRRAIQCFEPRLSKLQVLPRELDTEAGGNRLAFLIEAELWGQPSSEHLLLHTELDLESSDATVRPAEGAH